MGEKETGLPNLYFAVNLLERVPGKLLCCCGRRMGAVENYDAAARVADFLTREGS